MQEGSGHEAWSLWLSVGPAGPTAPAVLLLVWCPRVLGVVFSYLQYSEQCVASKKWLGISVA